MSGVLVMLALLAFVGTGVAIAAIVRDLTGSWWIALGAEAGAMAILPTSVILALWRPIKEGWRAEREVEKILARREGHGN